MGAGQDFDTLVARFYEPLYQFAFTLTRVEADACDLTQETFHTWATKGHQLRDPSKVKTWLFTTLHRLFLQQRRRASRFPHLDIGTVDLEIEAHVSSPRHEPDARQVLHALAEVDESFQAAVALFYLHQHSYQEIAEILGVPLGTVKSRISRGIAQLRQLLHLDEEAAD